MEIKASNVAATHLHCRKMSVAREGERCQILGGCWLPVTLNNKRIFTI
jgi:hypothetical protein